MNAHIETEGFDLWQLKQAARHKRAAKFNRGKRR